MTAICAVLGIARRTARWRPLSQYSLVAEKVAVTVREKELIDGLNAVQPGRPKATGNRRRRRGPRRPPKLLKIGRGERI